MRTIFLKITFVLLIVLFATVWLGGGVLNKYIHFSSSEQQPAEALTGQPENNPQDNTPALVRLIVQTTEPVAAELRGSFNIWWEAQKAHLADQLSEWLAQQQQAITEGIQTKIRGMIYNALGVEPSPSQ